MNIREVMSKRRLKKLASLRDKVAGPKVNKQKGLRTFDFLIRAFFTITCVDVVAFSIIHVKSANKLVKSRLGCMAQFIIRPGQPFYVRIHANYHFELISRDVRRGLQLLFDCFSEESSNSLPTLSTTLNKIIFELRTRSDAFCLLQLEKRTGMQSPSITTKEKQRRSCRIVSARQKKSAEYSPLACSNSK